jgi:topoisomerase-4 subunit A
VLYLTANPNGEAEVVTINLKGTTSARIKAFDMDFAAMAIKGRDAQGNIVTKHPVRKVVQKEKGVSTLSAQKIWFDDTVQRLNTEERGTYLGEFAADDKIVVVTQNGEYRLSGFDLTSHFEENSVLICKLDMQRPLTMVYWEGEKKKYYIKRFLPEETDKKILLISEAPGSQLETITEQEFILADLKFSKDKGKDIPDQQFKVAGTVPVTGIKTQGKPLNYPHKIKEVQFVPDPDAPKVTQAIAELANDEFEFSELSPVEEAKTAKPEPKETHTSKKAPAAPAPKKGKTAAKKPKPKGKGKDGDDGLYPQMSLFGE